MAACFAASLAAASLAPSSPFAVAFALLAGLSSVERGGGRVGGGEVDHGGAKLDFGINDPLFNGSEIGHGIGFGEGVKAGFIVRGEVEEEAMDLEGLGEAGSAGFEAIGYLAHAADIVYCSVTGDEVGGEGGHIVGVFGNDGEVSSAASDRLSVGIYCCIVFGFEDRVSTATHNEISICGGLVGGDLELGLKGGVARRRRERRGLAGVVRFGGREGMGAAEDDVKDMVGGDPCIVEDSADAADERVPVAAAGGAAWVRKQWGGGGMAPVVVGGEMATRGGDEAVEGSGAGGSGWRGRGDAGAEAATRPRRGAARAAAVGEAATTRARRQRRGRGGERRGRRRLAKPRRCGRGGGVEAAEEGRRGRRRLAKPRRRGRGGGDEAVEGGGADGGGWRSRGGGDEAAEGSGAGGGGWRGRDDAGAEAAPRPRRGATRAAAAGEAAATRVRRRL
ncbi:unnamed protein product [Closterium sp. NIES-64]|nr:unnamed protein product [Closterium sp. NIES-64]